MPLLGQLTKTVNVSTPGTLKNNLTETECNTVTSLTVSGNIDARDFAFIRDKVKIVSTIDLTNSIIKAYSGVDGTNTGVETSYTVNELPMYAFYNPYLYLYKSSLSSFKFPANTSSVGYLAFYYCWNLAGTLNIPGSVKNITDYAFYGCASLSGFTVAGTNSRYSALNGVLFSKNQDTLFVYPQSKAGVYSIPTSVKHIGPSAFENSYYLTSLTLPEGLQSIGSYAFCNCSGISGDLTLPSTLKKMDEGAFYNCSKLNGTVSLPASLTDMGEYCFLESNNIVAYNVNASNPNYSSYNGVFYSKNMDTLFIYPAAKSGNFIMPSTVKLIGSHAFYKSSKLSGQLIIPRSVDYIGYYAFYGCTAISGFQANAENLYFSSESGVLMSKTKERLISCPASLTGPYQMPATIKSIDPAAMAFCSNITGNLNIPMAVDTIGAFAFYGCNLISGFNVEGGNKRFASLDGVLYNALLDSLLLYPLNKSGAFDVPNGVKYIGISAFDGCTKLSEINLANSVETIGDYAFEYCSTLTNFHFPQSVVNIGKGALYSCTNLQGISIANPTPPLLDYYALDQVNKETCKLTVPTGSATLYKSRPYWSEFKSITEFNYINGLKQYVSNEIKISAIANSILIESSNPLSTIYLYNLRGLLIARITTEETDWQLNALNPGIYILKVSDRVFKILL